MGGIIEAGICCYQNTQKVPASNYVQPLFENFMAGSFNKSQIKKDFCQAKYFGVPQGHPLNEFQLIYQVSHVWSVS